MKQMPKMHISGEFANEKINEALRKIETKWIKASFTSKDFKAERRLFKQVLFNELTENYDVCDHGC